MQKVLVSIWNYKEVKEYAKKLNLSVTSFINVCIGRWMYFNDTYNSNN